MEIIDYVCKGCGARDFSILSDQVECNYCGSKYFMERPYNYSLFHMNNIVVSTGVYMPLMNNYLKGW